MVLIMVLIMVLVVDFGLSWISGLSFSPVDHNRIIKGDWERECKENW